jgi:hypothetical protein
MKYRLNDFGLFLVGTVLAVSTVIGVVGCGSGVTKAAITPAPIVTKKNFAWGEGPLRCDHYCIEETGEGCPGPEDHPYYCSD